MPCAALHLALLCLFLGACTGGQHGASKSSAPPGASVRFAREAKVTLVSLRVAVAYEIRYLNTKPGRHPLPSELVHLEPGERELVVLVEAKMSPGEEPAQLRRAWTVHVPGSERSVVTITLSSSEGAPTLALRVRGARHDKARPPTPPVCTSLNPDLAPCDGAADPPARALCVIRSIRKRAKQKLNPGWMGCANHQGNRLRTARQQHGHAAAKGDDSSRVALFARSVQLEKQARACVKHYFLCD